MKEYKSVLSDDFADFLYEYAISQVMGENPDQPSMSTNYSWEPLFRKNNSIVFSISLKEDLNNKIKESIINNGIVNKDYFDYIDIKLNIWTKNSYISSHRDGSYYKAITIYLNRDWSYDDGGIFNWLDKSDNQWKIIIPKFNYAVVNDSGEIHAVTPVLTEDKLRITIQCFISEKDN